MKYLAALCLAISSLIMHAQNVYVYTYDDAGNRIQRDMVPLRLANPNGGNSANAAHQISEAEGAVAELNDQLQISLFPNPTAGEVNLEFSAAEHFTEEVRIISSRGELVYQKQDITGNFTVPFVNLPAGNYFIWLKLNGSIERFQVIKE